MEFLLRAGGRHCFLARDKNKKDHKKLQRVLVNHCLKQTKLIETHQSQSKHVFPKRSAKMIDGTEKPKTPLKFEKHSVRYNEFGYNYLYLT